MDIEFVIKTALKNCIGKNTDQATEIIKTAIITLIEEEVSILLTNKWLSMPENTGLERFCGVKDLTDQIFKRKENL